MICLLNAFSANMIADFPASVRFTEVSPELARELLLHSAVQINAAEYRIRSAVGHEETAAVFSSVLGLTVECRRETITLKSGDTAVVGQYSGIRLPIGATQLPEGSQIRWLTVEVQ